MLHKHFYLIKNTFSSHSWHISVRVHQLYTAQLFFTLMDAVIKRACFLPLLWIQGDESEADARKAGPEGPEREPGCHSWPSTHDPRVQETLQGQWFKNTEAQ